MAYKNIFSQMFDVRPRDKRGDLDWGKINRIKALLDLAGKKEGPASIIKSARVVNLKKSAEEKKAKIELEKKIPNKVKGKKRVGRKINEEKIRPLIGYINRLLPVTPHANGSHPWRSPASPSDCRGRVGAGVNLEEINASAVSDFFLPSGEEILAQWEDLERLDNLLQAEIAEKEAGVLEEILEPEEDFSEEIIKKRVAEELLAIPEITEPIFTEALPANEDLESLILAETAREAARNLSPESDSAVWYDEWLKSWREEAGLKQKTERFSWPRFSLAALKIKPQKSIKKAVLTFASAGFFIFIVIFGLSIVGQGLSAKDNILSSALSAYQAMLKAKDSASRLDFGSAQVNFETAYGDFWQAEQELNKMGRSLIYLLERLPGGSVVSSGAALIEAGENLARAGRSFSQIAQIFFIEKIGDYFSGSQSFTQKIWQSQQELKIAQAALVSASENLAKVDLADLPTEMAEPVNSWKEKMPLMVKAVSQLNDWSNVFLEVLGHERAKKYLLIFQNNAEARPTGGFIGTYGVLDLDQGRIKKLFIDGIFNLDGQLAEKIIPPKPIQKISTAWSTHDANWFADWPTSAQKITRFYEKAGGETVDGVISLTPTIIERLLALTGPIDLPAYGVSLNQDNFLDVTQYKVEVDYDKELNQPKKILTDFTPLFLERLWQVWPTQGQEIFRIFNDALAEKHILFYFINPTLEKTFQEQGWAGEILQTDKDYLSVVNANINGYKTDRVVEQKIYHQSEIQNDGSIIDTIKILRRHNGGQNQYDWYNKVNADYLRVYAPLGSKLLSAQGHTLEAYVPPIDYEKLGFKADADVLTQEQSMAIDANSGTQIFSESGKTVFGNWVYVSPGEAVEITYQYLLPFKLNLSAENFSYSLLAQKQAGSVTSGFESVLTLPREFKISWQYPENLQISGSQIKFTSDLKTDKFFGVVLTK